MGAAADVLYSCRILSGMRLNQIFLNQAPHRMGLVKKILVQIPQPSGWLLFSRKVWEESVTLRRATIGPGPCCRSQCNHIHSVLHNPGVIYIAELIRSTSALRLAASIQRPYQR